MDLLIQGSVFFTFIADSVDDKERGITIAIAHVEDKPDSNDLRKALEEREVTIKGYREASEELLFEGAFEPVKNSNSDLIGGRPPF